MKNEALNLNEKKLIDAVITAGAREILEAPLGSALLFHLLPSGAVARIRSEGPMTAEESRAHVLAYVLEKSGPEFVERARETLKPDCDGWSVLLRYDGPNGARCIGVWLDATDQTKAALLEDAAASLTMPFHEAVAAALSQGSALVRSVAGAGMIVRVDGAMVQVHAPPKNWRALLHAELLEAYGRAKTPPPDALRRLQAVGDIIRHQAVAGTLVVAVDLADPGTVLAGEVTFDPADGFPVFRSLLS